MSTTARTASTIVLASTGDPLRPLDHLRAVWDRVENLGWLAEASSRIIIQVGQRHRSPLVVDTAQSLAGWLRERFSVAEILVVDPAAHAEDWRPLPLLNDASPFVTISAVVPPRQLRVPKLWFESYFLATVAGAGQSSYGRISGILEAQAEPLNRVAGSFCAAGRAVVEAHRLAASDLCVLCGNEARAKRDSTAWWLVSASDVAIDRAVATAAGKAPRSLPTLRAIAHHETLADTPVLEGTLNVLQGYITPAFLADCHALWSRIRVFQQMIMQDASVARTNIHKIPRFIRKRLARAKAAGGTT